MAPVLTRPASVVAALPLALALLAAPAAAQQATGSNNPREAPNAACDSDTPPAPFADRSAAAATHRRNLDCLAARGVAAGSRGAYRPLEPVTRGQMATFVARTLEQDGQQLPPPRDQGFSDDGDSVHRDRIRQLAAIGVVEGRTPDRYEPQGLVTRGQMAAFLVRAASWAHDTSYRPTGSAGFADTGDSVHDEAVRTGFELWLLEGRTASTYAPGATVRRDAMASFLSRTLDLLRPEDGTVSTHPTYLLGPQEPITVPPGEAVEFQVLGRYDDGPLGRRLHLALLPCRDVAFAPDAPRVADADGDGRADGLASSDTGQARIASVNGAATPPGTRLVRSAPTRSDGTTAFTVVAPAADCTVPVVFEARGSDSPRIDALGLVANPYAVGQARWQ